MLQALTWRGSERLVALMSTLRAVNITGCYVILNSDF